MNGFYGYGGHDCRGSTGSSSGTARAFDLAPQRWERFAEPSLRGAAVFWYCAAALGPLVFAVYVVGFLGIAAAAAIMWLPHL